MKEQLKNKLLEYLEAIENGVIEVAPEAWEVIVRLEFYESLWSVIVNVILLLISIMAAKYVAYPAHQRARKIEEERGEAYYENEGVGDRTISLAVGLFAVIVGVTCFINLILFETWLGVLDPQLAVIKDILDSIKGT